MFEKVSQKLTFKSFAPSGNKADQCELCNQVFDWKHKAHQCKRCLRAICYYCGPDKAIIPSHDTKGTHRICKNCKDDQAHQKQLMDVENCRTGQLSNLGKRWASLAVGDNVQIQQIQQEYQKSLPGLLKNSKDEIKQQIQQNLLKIYKENKSTLNYSLFDWHYKCCEKESDNTIVQKLSNVLTCFFQTFPIRLTKNLVFLTTYILYFCDEAVALKVLQFLHQKVIPQRFQYHKLDNDESKPIEGEVNLLLEFLNDQSNNVNDKLMKKIKVFFDTYSTTMLTTFLFNHLEFYVGYFLFNQVLISPDFSTYEKFLANICLQLNKVWNEAQIDDIPQIIIKNIQLEQFTTFLSMEDEKKRQYRTSLSVKEQAQSQIQLNKKNDDDSFGSILESIVEVIQENQNQKLDTLLNNQQFNKYKNSILEIIKLIKQQKEELEIQRNSFSQLKSDYDNYLEQTSKCEKQVDTDSLIHRISSTSQKSELNEKESEKFNIATLVEQQQKMQQEQIAKLQEEFEQSQTEQLQKIQQQYQQQQKDQLAQQQQQQQQEHFQQLEKEKQLHKLELKNLKDTLENQQKLLTIQIQKEMDIREETHRQEIAELHKEVSELRFENNSLQIELQKAIVNKQFYESQLKERIMKEQENEMNKITEERNILLKKTSDLQNQLNIASTLNNENNIQIIELKQQIEELKNNSDQLNDLCNRQNEQQEKLNLHIEQLNLQLQGYKRKQSYNIVDQQQQIDQTKELQENNLQLRNQLLLKEKELYRLKCSFVEINQQKIEYFDQMQQFDKENKQLKERLSLIEQSDIAKTTEHYEQKIQLLEQTHEEQMNRLFQQFQDQQQQPITLNENHNEQQQTTPQENNQKRIESLEVQQNEQTNGQSDDCRIF